MAGENFNEAGDLRSIRESVATIAAAPETVAPTMVDSSITNMSGASQSVVAAGAGERLIYMYAPITNVGTIWINLAGGTAIVGAGLPIIPGGDVSIQPGVANAVTGIAATANDDLTVYAG